MVSVLAVLLLSQVSTPISSPKALKPFPLTIESIMRGPALVGEAPRGLRWSGDSSTLQFSWAKADGSANPAMRGYSVKKDGSGLAPSTGPEQSGPPAGADRLGDLFVYASAGDVYLLDRVKHQTRRLTSTGDRKSNPIFVDGGKAVAYQSNGNAFRINLDKAEIIQLTDIHSDPPATVTPPTIPPTASQSALADEESKLFKGLAGGRGRGFGGRGRRGGRGQDGSVGASFQIPAGVRSGELTVSPSGKFASVELITDPKGVRQTEVPNYVTRSGYTEEIPSYEKVGDNQARSEIELLDLSGGDPIEMALPRAGTIDRVRWSPDGEYAIVRADAEDHKDAWILGFDAAKAKVSVLWDEHDDAWVGGPGQGLLGWLPDGKRFYFESEKTGFANLMTMAADGSDPQVLVGGPFEVSDVTMDADRRRFLFVSSEGSLFRRHVDAVDFDGANRKKLAELSADEDAAYALSPDGKSLAVVRSLPNRPAELFVNDVQVTHTPTAEWLAGPWIVPATIMIPARDGVSVPARLYKPRGWRRGGPAVIFVHGAGYLQNVYDGWSHYFREYMFHHILMDRGYAVLDVDYRGSAGYGKVWRTAIYRFMGGKDLTDQVDGAKWLVKNLGVAPDRIGIYGGSYGGFITLMAMFTTPDVFAAGAALRPVSDWANYNHGYTSDILNLPQNDKEAYLRSSPIYHAEGLKGALLICHGMVDTNVHFQDTVRLIERLIELGKTNWEVAPYPVEDHGFTRPESWTDEYRRILALFDRTIGSGRLRR